MSDRDDRGKGTRDGLLGTWLWDEQTLAKGSEMVVAE